MEAPLLYVITPTIVMSESPNSKMLTAFAGSEIINLFWVGETAAETLDAANP